MKLELQRETANLTSIQSIQIFVSKDLAWRKYARRISAVGRIFIPIRRFLQLHELPGYVKDLKVLLCCEIFKS